MYSSAAGPVSSAVPSPSVMKQPAPRGGGGGAFGGAIGGGGGLGPGFTRNSIALPTFRRPSLTHFPASAEIGSTVSMRARFTCAPPETPLSDGFPAYSRAAAPATCGVAMDVPLYVA